MSIYELRTELSGIESNLRELMDDKNISTRELAARSKIARSIIQKAMGPKIKTCKLETLAIIARCLGVCTKDLYSEK
jgi:DNA-binding Xre family transcriptional regulator